MVHKDRCVRCDNIDIMVEVFLREELRRLYLAEPPLDLSCDGDSLDVLREAVLLLDLELLSDFWLSADEFRLFPEKNIIEQGKNTMPMRYAAGVKEQRSKNARKE